MGPFFFSQQTLNNFFFIDLSYASFILKAYRYKIRSETYEIKMVINATKLSEPHPLTVLSLLVLTNKVQWLDFFTCLFDEPSLYTKEKVYCVACTRYRIMDV